MVVLLTCKNEEAPIKNEGARLLKRFPHYNPKGDMCKTELQSDLAQNLMQPFPLPNEASDKI